MKKSIELSYEAYLNGTGDTDGECSETLRRVSAETETKLEAGTLTTADLGDYEEAAAHAAFYAGFLAAKNM